MKKHAKQVAAWARILGHCHTLGASYNPSKDFMKRTAMENLLDQAQKSIEAVHNAEGAYTHTVNEREALLAQLPGIGVRVMGALQTLDVSDQHLKDVNRIRKRFRYQPPPDKKGTAQKNASGEQAEGKPEGAEPSSTPIPRSQLDIDSRIDNFTSLIKLLEQAEYTTDESDITLDALKAFLASLKQKHDAVAKAELNVYNAKTTRNALLFGPYGIHGISKRVKGYYRMKFGFTSEQFQAIHKIKIYKN